MNKLKNMIMVSEYFKKKYIVSTILGGISIVVFCLILYFFYATFIFGPFFAGEYSDIIFAFVLAYAISYFHERIPPCPSPFYEKIIRFGLMIYFMILPIFFFFISPGLSFWGIIFVLNSTFVASFIPSIVIVYTMYQFSPKKELHYNNKNK